MVIIETPSGRMSVRPSDVKSTDVIVRSGSTGSAGGGVSTREDPTPSAELLFGSAEQREQQITAFRTGGQSAFQLEVARARSSIVQAEQLRAEQQRQIEAQRSAEVFEARKEYQLRSAKAKSDVERQEALQDFLSVTESAKQTAQEKRLKAGVSISATTRTPTSATTATTQTITKADIDKVETLGEQQALISQQERQAQAKVMNETGLFGKTREICGHYGI